MSAGNFSDASKLNEALREVGKLRDAVKSLERRSEKQAALLRALSELFFEKTGVTEPEFLAAIARIEHARAGQAERDCANCDRPLKLNSRKCLYCGYEVPVTTVFDLL